MSMGVGNAHSRTLCLKEIKWFALYPFFSNNASHSTKKRKIGVEGRERKGREKESVRERERKERGMVLSFWFQLIWDPPVLSMLR